MAITTEQLNNLLTVVVGMFDGAPTNDILSGLAAKVENGTSIPELADELGETGEFQSIYRDFLPNETFAAQFAESLLGNTVDSATKAEGADFIEGLLNSGSSRGEAAYAAINALSNASEDDPTWGNAAAQLNNKVEVAYRFIVSSSNYENLSMEELRSVVSDVDHTDESVTEKKMLIDAGILNAEEATQRLTTGLDYLKGTSANEIFKAAMGTLTTGDEIDGGAGSDLLRVTLDSSSAVQAEVSNVETAEFQAQLAVGQTTADNEIPDDFDLPGSGNSGSGSDDENRDAQVDAGRMYDTTTFWNRDSRADLVIEDVRNNSHETRIVMQDTDNGDVDYAVYFDDQHITAPGATQANSQLFLELLDLEAAADTGEKLTNNPYKGVVIFVGDERVELVDDAAINAANLGREPTFQDIVNALNFSLAAQGYTTITASLGEEFDKANSDSGIRYTGTTIVLTNEGSEELSVQLTDAAGNTTYGGWLADGAVPPGSNIHTNITDVPPEVTTSLTQVNIDLDNVGRGSESGDFRAGNMSNQDSGSDGIQQFNVTVHDSSWITSMSTTTDDLEEVYVVNSQELVDMAPAGDLRIGDNGYNDTHTGLQNVRVFDASAMTGAVTLEADLDDAVIGKYFDLEDTRASYEIDNVQFQYTLTDQADELVLTVSEEAVSYEDFELDVVTGAGDDNVIFEVTGTETDNLDTRWNEDQADLNNIVISTGAGNDTVRTKGDGEVTINTGSGNDVVYSDNSGLTNTDNNVATWVFNAQNTKLNDLEGSGANTDIFLYNATVTVTFSAGSTGAGVTEALADDFGNGFESGAISIDLDDFVADMGDVNQALKEAINNDATLSKWLLAEDGPNNSVVVTSLVDGVFQNDDLLVTVENQDLPTTGTAGFNAVQEAWEAFNNDSEIGDITNANLDDQLDSIGSGYSRRDFDNTTNTGAAILATDLENEVQTLSLTAGNLEATDTVTFSVDGGGTVVFTVPAGASTDFDTPAEIAAAIIAGTGVTTTGTGSDYTITAGTNAVDLVFTHTGTAADLAPITVTSADNASSGDYATVTATNAETTKGVAGITYTGVASDEEANNNTINLGTGDDVLALSTNDDSAETIVFTGTSIGNNDILNFADAEDFLNFTAYLTDIETANGSTSTQSEQHLRNTLVVEGANNADLSSNEVVLFNDFAQDIAASAGETWANLTANDLKAALNNDATNDYGNIDAATFTQDGSSTAGYEFEGSTMSNIIMVENDLNDGEYKVFDVTSSVGDVAADEAVTSVTLLGTVDFGEELAGTTLVVA